MGDACCKRKRWVHNVLYSSRRRIHRHQPQQPLSMYVNSLALSCHQEETAANVRRNTVFVYSYIVESIIVATLGITLLHDKLLLNFEKSVCNDVLLRLANI